MNEPALSTNFRLQPSSPQCPSLLLLPNEVMCSHPRLSAPCHPLQIQVANVLKQERPAEHFAIISNTMPLSQALMQRPYTPHSNPLACLLSTLGVTDVQREAMQPKWEAFLATAQDLRREVAVCSLKLRRPRVSCQDSVHSNQEFNASSTQRSWAKVRL